MIDIEAEARAIVDGKDDAWGVAVEKLTQAWEDDDQAAIAAWRKVFFRYADLAYELDLNDGFYDYQVWENCAFYSAGNDPRPTPEMSEEEEAAMVADTIACQAERDANPPVDYPPGYDDDIPF